MDISDNASDGGREQGCYQAPTDCLADCSKWFDYCVIIYINELYLLISVGYLRISLSLLAYWPARGMLC